MVGLTRYAMDYLPILVAEDNEDDAFLLQRALARAGVANPVRFVGDGEQVLAYLHGEGKFADRAAFPFPGLLLLDVKMPRMTGLEALSVIRSDPGLKRLVVIFLSSSGREGDINQAFDLQANSYLVKPSHQEAMGPILEALKGYWLGMNQYPNCPIPEAKPACQPTVTCP
jgi:CheY-like chemotaxis protein